MKIKFLFLPIMLLSISCISLGGTKKKVVTETPVAPTFYNYTIQATYPHKTDSYTQGLIFYNGRLLEGTGQIGESRILEVDLESGNTQEMARLSGSHFGEGITILGDTLYQLTWITNRLFLYDATTFERLGEKIYKGQGWGITNDGEKLYVSDGSSVITVRDPQSYKVERRILVTVGGEPLEYLNELEWIDGKIWANVYTLDQIAIIDPESGVVEGVVNLMGLLTPEDETLTTDVLNGIAYDEQSGKIYVTGKNWNKLFEIKIE
ncbi:MAG: glutaminyl-peptide cyclotransferase [Rikenellaceae bacterium]